jgi:EAL domain-containing protein (putative c-di-GMP-specific phosphodiesterase class I)/CheY-like chemotaxis protein
VARILTVDDDELINTILVRALSGAGHEVHSAYTGDEAMRLMQDHRFDVAVVDLELPGADGLSVLAALRGVQPACGRILSSGRLDLASVVDAVNRGEVGRVLSKPYQVQVLLQAVSEQLAALEVRSQAWRQAVDRERRSWFHEAVDAGQLRLAFQPIIDADSGTTVAQEGLLRGFHPRLRSPADILEVAESADLLGELASVVAARGAEFLTVAPAEQLLFLNLHPRDFGQDDLERRLSPLLPWATRVVLEITERAAIHEVPSGHATIQRLSELGFGIAVDDLGAGYSSLSMLAELDPRYVKVDMSIIRGIDTTPHKRRVLELLCRFADAGGATLIAEGIETEAEADVVRACGARWLQGYLYGRPALPSVASA